MDTFLISFVVVALAELGDKTQGLARLLGEKYRRPAPLCLALIAASVASHVLGGAVALAMGLFMKPDALRWTLCVGFVGLAAWAMSSDACEEPGEKARPFGVFGLATVAFFLVQFGGKSQVATVVLAAQSKAIVEAVAGTTLGVLVANLPAVVSGDRWMARLPADALRWVAAAVFAALAYFAYFGGGARFGF